MQQRFTKTAKTHYRGGRQGKDGTTLRKDAVTEPGSNERSVTAEGLKVLLLKVLYTYRSVCRYCLVKECL
ncbi:hypothetical protein NIES970_10130 [[Synechococcus] sp. NIES-970]|nr:hypothetical protein NIES970_10130 [[Synechococcus] sp. NIES-970]